MQYSTVQYRTGQESTQYSTVQYSTLHRAVHMILHGTPPRSMQLIIELRAPACHNRKCLLCREHQVADFTLYQSNPTYMLYWKFTLSVYSQTFLTKLGGRYLFYFFYFFLHIMKQKIKASVAVYSKICEIGSVRSKSVSACSISAQIVLLVIFLT